MREREKSHSTINESYLTQIFWPFYQCIVQNPYMSNSSNSSSITTNRLQDSMLLSILYIFVYIYNICSEALDDLFTGNEKRLWWKVKKRKEEKETSRISEIYACASAHRNINKILCIEWQQHYQQQQQPQQKQQGQTIRDVIYQTDRLLFLVCVEYGAVGCVYNRFRFLFSLHHFRIT